MLQIGKRVDLKVIAINCPFAFTKAEAFLKLDHHNI